MNSVKLRDTKSTYKPVAFLYTNNKVSEKEIKTISFTITSKGIKCLEIKLIKEAEGSQRDIWAPASIASLLAITKMQRQGQCPQTEA